MIATGTEVCSLHFQVGRPLVENRLNDVNASPVVIQHNFHGLYLSQGQRKAALESCVRFATTLSRLNQARNKYYGGITK